MALEIEKKYRLPTSRAESLRQALRKANADFLGVMEEENTIYGGRGLDKISGVLRIRKTAGKALFTFKRRIEIDSDIKHQIEHETAVDNADELEAMLKELGYQRRLVYEKRRETWVLNDVEIVIDELPFGWFVEIEGQQPSIVETEKLLDLEDLVTEHETYPQLTERFGRPSADVVEAKFDRSEES
jgi:adenylate cyclase class 2